MGYLNIDFNNKFVCGKIVDKVDKKIISQKTQYIKLDQLLKLAGIAGTGGESKFLIEEGKVLVNEEIEKRRGRKIFPGDQIAIGDEKLLIIINQETKNDRTGLI